MTTRPARRHLAFACAAILLAVAQGAGAQERVGDFRVKLEKWVETRQIVSEETSDWDAERETLRATQDLLRQQKAALQEEIAELDSSLTEADEQRVDLLLRRGEAQRSSGAVEEALAALEAQVKALVPRLPEPLQERLAPLLVQIPETPEETKVPLGRRLINVLGVILQAEKFNSTATLVGETRPVGEDGQKIQIRTLYWGLGRAIYVDSQGEVAGSGKPGPEGWVFADDRGLADDAKLLLDIYESNVDVIQFVKIPVQIE